MSEGSQLYTLKEKSSSPCEATPNAFVYEISRRNTPATLASWYVDNVERVVDELTSQGIAYGRHDEGPMAIDEKGIATFEGGAKAT